MEENENIVKDVGYLEAKEEVIEEKVEEIEEVVKETKEILNWTNQDVSNLYSRLNDIEVKFNQIEEKFVLLENDIEVKLNTGNDEKDIVEELFDGDSKDETVILSDKEIEIPIKKFIIGII